MIFTAAPLKGVYVVEPEPYSDQRGWFARTYCQEEFAAIGHDKPWLQINHSFTQQSGTIRGMHFQKPPFSEIKLLRCIAGAIFDVVVDMREDSPTRWQWFGIELSAVNRKMLYIPEGFAHGFETLQDNTELIYHHSQLYMPGAEGGLRFDDPALAIQWPLPVRLVSERDKQHPLLKGSNK